MPRVARCDASGAICRATRRGTRHSPDRGSTLPLILGFFLLALLLVAGGVAAGDAFVQQRGLQDVCDGAAVAAASTAARIDRNSDAARTGLTFTGLDQAVSAYLAREPSRAGVQVSGGVSADGQTLTLTCRQTEHVAFGAMFGKGDGVEHIATSSARAPLTP